MRDCQQKEIVRKNRRAVVAQPLAGGNSTAAAGSDQVEGVPPRFPNMRAVSQDPETRQPVINHPQSSIRNRSKQQRRGRTNEPQVNNALKASNPSLIKQTETATAA